MRDGAERAAGRALLFDVGNVIVHFDFAPARRHLEAASEVAGDPLECLAALKVELELGRIDGATFIDRAVESLGYRGTRAEFRRVWEEIFSINPAMARTIEQAHSNFPLFLLSNTSDIHREALFRDFPVFGCFAGGVYSYLAHRAKPDAEIYRQAIDEFGLVPAETLYVDDRPENVAAGARAGLVSILYDPLSHERFLWEASERGFAL